MDIYKTADRKTLVVIPDMKLTKQEAIKEANAHFHTKVSSLQAKTGSVINDELYLEPRSKGKTVWVVSKK